MKWITCPACDEQKVVQDSARSCSPRCRNRVWRRRHGLSDGRSASCAWCNSPLLYMPQEKFPGVRRCCDRRCARRAWLFARARRMLATTRAVEIAFRRLRKSRTPSVRAAAFTLADLHRELTDREQAERAARVAAFLSRLPP